MHTIELDALASVTGGSEIVDLWCKHPWIYGGGSGGFISGNPGGLVIGALVSKAACVLYEGNKSSNG